MPCIRLFATAADSRCLARAGLAVAPAMRGGLLVLITLLRLWALCRLFALAKLATLLAVLLQLTSCWRGVGAGDTAGVGDEACRLCCCVGGGGCSPGGSIGGGGGSLMRCLFISNMSGDPSGGEAPSMSCTAPQPVTATCHWAPAMVAATVISPACGCTCSTVQAADVKLSISSLRAWSITTPRTLTCTATNVLAWGQ